ncbi:hypothetical protein [Infirmifilum sp. NZ]|uniref:hypothetical protein n=1 Tax=Infirmifilum sp. NZ TaxID=2926850 RepID=UPI0027A9F184|nr:hypothetical protein [Infirmifilum sp. NZ]UNQ73975.1 hypothetical protein MOV14_02895 [Infirmifilum sp. NZ]
MAPTLSSKLDFVDSPLALQVSIVLRNRMKELLAEAEKLPPAALAERIYELLRRSDVNVEVTLEPIATPPYLLVHRNPLRLILVLRGKAYQVWPELAPLRPPGFELIRI